MPTTEEHVQAIRDALRTCVAKGMKLPFVFCVIDDDGTPYWLKTDRVEVEVDASGPMPKSPKMVLVTDHKVQAKIILNWMATPRGNN
jgi:hypothetical protein